MMSLTDRKYKILEFIERGNKIKLTAPSLPNGTHVLDVDVSLFEAWMGEIYYFSERYLKDHPLYQSIRSVHFHKTAKVSCCDSLIGLLQAISADKEYFGEPEEHIVAHLTMTDFIKEDIKRINSIPYLEETEIKDLYLEITSRYVDEIPNFGNGLYSYYPEMRHFDCEISISTMKHNFKIIEQRLKTYLVKTNPAKQVEYKNSVNNNKVFIVHGHDNESKESVARMLEKAGFEAIILHEQASTGKTIIEKIEKYSDVSFAVILYTGCDIGRDKNSAESDNRYRARQNVVFEHGYLIAKLGRDRVCALVKGNVETPGDISGVVYVQLDKNGAWKLELAKEMKSAGLSVDLNKL